LTRDNTQTRGALIASAVIIVATVIGWLFMPKVMLLVSGGGPFVGVAIAILFMLGFFAVLWLRSRYQQRSQRD
jgi:amino acid transporter